MSKSFTIHFNRLLPEQHSYLSKSLPEHMANDPDRLHTVAIEDLIRVRSTYDEYDTFAPKLPRNLFFESLASVAPYLSQNLMPEALEIMEES